MLRFFKFNTVLATIACTCLAGNVLASEVNTCSNNLKSNDICPVAVDNKKITTVKSPLENRSSNLYTEVSQPKEKDETASFTLLQLPPDFDATQIIFMLGGMVLVTMILQQKRHDTSFNTVSIESNYINQANSRLQKKVLTLVKSPETVKRLFISAQIKYPERSPNWLLEKIIYDLERDRKAY